MALAASPAQADDCAGAVEEGNWRIRYGLRSFSDFMLGETVVHWFQVIHQPTSFTYQFGIRAQRPENTYLYLNPERLPVDSSMGLDQRKASRGVGKSEGAEVFLELSLDGDRLADLRGFHLFEVWRPRPGDPENFDPVPWEQRLSEFPLGGEDLKRVHTAMGEATLGLRYGHVKGGERREVGRATIDTRPVTPLLETATLGLNQIGKRIQSLDQCEEWGIGPIR